MERGGGNATWGGGWWWCCAWNRCAVSSAVEDDEAVGGGGGGASVSDDELGLLSSRDAGGGARLLGRALPAWLLLGDVSPLAAASYGASAGTAADTGGTSAFLPLVPRIPSAGHAL